MKLEDIRKQIDEIDDRILSLLANRFTLSQKAKQVKLLEGKHIVDEERERDILQKRKEQARYIGLPIDLVTSIFSTIIKYSVEAQKSEL